MPQRTDRPAGNNGSTGLRKIPEASTCSSSSSGPTSHTDCKATERSAALSKILVSVSMIASKPYEAKPESTQCISLSRAQCRRRWRRIAGKSRRLMLSKNSSKISAREAECAAAPARPVKSSNSLKASVWFPPFCTTAPLCSEPSTVVDVSLLLLGTSVEVDCEDMRPSAPSHADDRLPAALPDDGQRSSGGGCWQTPSKPRGDAGMTIGTKTIEFVCGIIC
mmetsp:Transcript_110729/g.319891  ORF Transcript_110729/g.319891 Transcript_110729/m.319891 type:complete len:222 (+) Transcript_110729:1131-1796(+)